MHSPLESAILRIAAAQHGVVTRRQLEAAGIAGHRIAYRVNRGRLLPLYQGVYRTGAAPSQLEREMAAVLAGGDGATLSHRSAAVLWNLIARAAAALIDVTIRGGRGLIGGGIRTHRMRHLPSDERTELQMIPITTPCRTVLDLAGAGDGAIDDEELERVVAIAFRSHLIAPGHMEEILKRHAGRRGSLRLRRILKRAAEPLLTRSEAEKLALKLFRKAELEPPKGNALVEGYEADFFWPAQRVIAEIDGFAFHSSPAEFERDRLRDAALTAAGYRVIRLTWRQLTRSHEAVVARLAATLAR